MAFKRIDIDLSRKKDDAGRVPVLIAAALAILAIVFSAYDITVFTAGKRSLQVLENVPVAAGADAARLRKEVDTANAIIRKETFAWTRLLTQIEKSVPSNVAVTQITPDFKNNSVSIGGAAKGVADALKFVDELGRSGAFKEVFLRKHAEGDRKSSEERITFEVSAVYVASGAAEVTR